MTITWLDRSVIKGPELTLCLSEAQFNEVLDQIPMPKEDRPIWAEHGQGRVHALMGASGNLVCVVCLNLPDDLHDTTASAGLLVHEAVHVFQQWVECLGEEKPSAEFMAYSIQHFSDTLWDSYAQQRASAN